MNIHHLELFYYVARHGGISEAVRKMPYGIQQPAVSAQIRLLEESLGVSLFQRRPFCLTPSGDKLYRFIQPFFDNVETVAEEIRGGPARLVRIGASDVVLKDHLPTLVQWLRERFPDTRLTLRAGYQPELIDQLRRQELDIALTLLDKNLPAPLKSMPVLRLPLVLLSSSAYRLKTPAELWSRKRVPIPLLCLPPEEAICKLFQDSLRARGVEWVPSLELSSLDLITTYVECGHGIGLTVAMPGRKFSRKITVVRLDDFPEVDFGVAWQGSPGPVLEALLEEVKARASQLAASGSTQASMPGSETPREANTVQPRTAKQASLPAPRGSA